MATSKGSGASKRASTTSTGGHDAQALKGRLREAKLRANLGEGGAAVETEKIKRELRQKKLADKLDRLNVKGDLVSALPSTRVARGEISTLRKEVAKLANSVGEPGSPGPPRKQAKRRVRTVTFDPAQLKDQIRLEKARAKEGTAARASATIDRLKDQIRIEKLWDKFSLLDLKWSRWGAGAGAIDPIPHRNIFNELQDLQRKIEKLELTFA